MQWKGYIQDVDAYHGEVLNKTQIQKNFDRKLNDCKQNRDHLMNYDWEGVKLILQNLFCCFERGTRLKNKHIN